MELGGVQFKDVYIMDFFGGFVAFCWLGMVGL